MPNTLAHLGVQSIFTRITIRDADNKWIYVGCILPDFSWILQRFVRIAFPSIDLYDLRLYAIVQASFCFCLLLSWALAMFSARFWKTFAILTLNAFLHLILDACQTKWANGVHFLAPFNWRLMNFGLFWPENPLTHLLGVLGLGYFITNWWRDVVIPVDITWRRNVRVWAAFTLIAVYLVLPLMFLDSAEAAGNHFVRTLRSRYDRAGQHVEFDRNTYLHRRPEGILRTFAGEELGVEGMALDCSASVSVRGTFITENRIRVHEYHVHTQWIRNNASYLGLILVALLWGYALVRQKSRTGRLVG